MKKLLSIIIIALALTSCNTSKKTASGGTIILQGKHHALSVGNPRIRKQKIKKALDKIGASEYDNNKNQ